MGDPITITITDVLIAISERRSWLKRFTSGDLVEKNAVIDEAVTELGGQPSEFDDPERSAVIDQNFSQIQSLIGESGGILFIHVC